MVKRACFECELIRAAAQSGDHGRQIEGGHQTLLWVRLCPKCNRRPAESEMAGARICKHNECFGKSFQRAASNPARREAHGAFAHKSSAHGRVMTGMTGRRERIW